MTLAEELREAYRRVLAMQGRCKPLGADYDALGAVLRAMKDAARHFHQGPVFLRWQAALGPAPPGGGNGVDWRFLEYFSEMHVQWSKLLSA